jgi:hypothetical protein
MKLVGLALLVVACGKEASDPPQGMGGSSTAGKTGTAGSAPAGAGASGKGGGGAGVPGAGGSGVMEGGAASGGSGVVEGGAASGGSAAQGGNAAECEQNADCVVHSDCCSCSAVPGPDSPGGCDLACIQSACAARGLEDPQAVCQKQRCVFDLSCDRSLVTCKAAVPSCPAGLVPSVLGTCWGPCLPASECSAVTDCDDCAAGEVCVSSDVFGLTRHCVPVAPECAAEPSCACTDACEFQCSETNGISCFCVQC